ncbi:MAG: hypothetical protein JJW00_04260 [Sulfurimonas sp.]|nr:hypothetical protein [Sulfurimonas sp.]
MMDIYDKIDAIFSGEAENKPNWANEILCELKEIKTLLKKKTKTTKETLPVFEYQGRKMGLDAKGMLYDKETSMTISREEALKIYEFVYNQQVCDKYSA